MLQTRNGRNERRREGQSLSLAIMPPKLRKMAFLQSGHLLLKIFLNKFRPKRTRLAGKDSIFYCCCSRSLVRRRQHPVHETPTIFTIMGPGRLLLVSRCEGGPGWAKCCSRKPQYCLGQGHHYNRQKNDRRHFPEVVRGLQKVYKELWGEKLENKKDCKTSHSFFISSFRA